MSETLLVRLKPYEPRRGFVLRRFTYQGIKFQVERGWYRVKSDIAEYLRSVRQVHSDPHSPDAFDVCTDEEAKALEAKEAEAEPAPKKAADNIKVTEARTVTTDDLPEKKAKKPKKAKSKS